MLNIYFEKVYGTNSESNVKEFAFFVNADIDDNGLVEVYTHLRDKHSHFKDMVDVFSTALTTIKSHMPNNTEVENENEQSYSIEVEPDGGSIFVRIFDSNFDVEGLIQNYTYAVGYLQSCLVNGGTVWKGGDE